MIPRGLLILGFGGHARSVADVALDAGIPALIFVEAGAQAGEEFARFQVISAAPESLQEGWTVFPAAGDNFERRRQISDATARSLPINSLVSRRAYVGTGAIIQTSSFVAHHAHIGPMASVGRGTIINTAAIVEHESHIGEFTHISVNATVSGRCRIGNFVFLGAGATVIDKICIVDRVVIGAGSTVVDDIVEAGLYVGSPARRVVGYTPTR